ncbi:MAG: septum formation initiator family protein [Lachnospiraceae bacterium]|nr:septum formation initiator family protein [Lachnospiraceae bacterium]
MSRRVAFRGKRQNRLGMFLVSVVIIMLLVVVSVNSFLLKQKQDVYAAREAELDALIAAEEQRTIELEEFKKYTQTQAYIEEIAKEKLGLVREGEIVFKMN